MVYRKSCLTLFSMSKLSIFNPGSKGSMFSDEDITAVMSVLYSDSTLSPVTLMHDPRSVS